MALTEVLINDFTTTLTADITATDTAIPVAAMPVGFDATKQTRIRIESEWILVTFTDSTHLAVVGGVAGRGVEQSTAASHVATTEVDFVATTAGMTGALVSSGGGSGGMTNPMTAAGDLIVGAGSVNLLAGMIPVCNGQDLGTPASNLTDGNPGTSYRFGSVQNGPALAVIDFGAAQSIGSCVVNQFNDPNMAHNWSIEASADNSTWVSVATENPSTGGVRRLAFTPVSYRYWRINDHASNGDRWVVAEWSMFAGAPGAPVRLPIGSEGRVLVAQGGVPAWTTAPVGSMLAGLFVATTAATWTSPGDFSTIPFDVLIDPNAAWDATNCWYTVPHPGRYQFYFISQKNPNDNNRRFIQFEHLDVAGTVTLDTIRGADLQQDGYLASMGSGVFDMVAGEHIRPRFYSNGSLSNLSPRFTVVEIDAWHGVLGGDTTWTLLAPYLVRGWTSRDDILPAAFRKDALGFIHFRGSIGGGSGGGNLTSALPSTHRPESDGGVYAPFTCNSGWAPVPGKLNFDTDGILKLWAGETWLVSLDGLTYAGGIDARQGSSGGYAPGSADAPQSPANPKTDEFDGTSVVAWTNFGPLAAQDINVTRNSHFYGKASGSGGTLCGIVQSAPSSFPYGIRTKLSGSTFRQNYQRGGGIVLLPAGAISGSSTPYYLGSVYDTGNSSGYAVEFIAYGTLSSFASLLASALAGSVGPLYFWVHVTDATHVDCYFSGDGFAWRPMGIGVTIPFSIGQIGLGLGEDPGVEAYFDYFRVSASY